MQVPGSGRPCARGWRSKAVGTRTSLRLTTQVLLYASVALLVQSACSWSTVAEPMTCMLTAESDAGVSPSSSFSLVVRVLEYGLMQMQGFSSDGDSAGPVHTVGPYFLDRNQPSLLAGFITFDGVTHEVDLGFGDGALACLHDARPNAESEGARPGKETRRQMWTNGAVYPNAAVPVDAFGIGFYSRADQARHAFFSDAQGKLYLTRTAPAAPAGAYDFGGNVGHGYPARAGVSSGSRQRLRGAGGSVGLGDATEPAGGAAATSTTIAGLRASLFCSRDLAPSSLPLMAMLLQALGREGQQQPQPALEEPQAQGPILDADEPLWGGDYGFTDQDYQGESFRNSWPGELTPGGAGSAAATQAAVLAAERAAAAATADAFAFTGAMAVLAVAEADTSAFTTMQAAEYAQLLAADLSASALMPVLDADINLDYHDPQPTIRGEEVASFAQLGAAATGASGNGMSSAPLGQPRPLRRHSVLTLPEAGTQEMPSGQQKQAQHQQQSWSLGPRYVQRFSSHRRLLQWDGHSMEARHMQERYSRCWRQLMSVLNRP